jgi:hypothetical protein
MTPEAYVAAVKACPRTAWIDFDWSERLVYGYAVAIQYPEIAGKVVPRDQAYGTVGSSYYGVLPYATAFNVDLRGKSLFDPSHGQPRCVLVSVVPDSVLSAHGFPKWLFGFMDGTDNNTLRRIEKRSTEDRICGAKEVWIDRIFVKTIPSKSDLHAYFISKYGKPERASRMEAEAAKELIAEQHEAARKQAADRRARDLWARYYSMVDEHHVTAMSGAEFERFIGKLYVWLGYHILLTQGGADQGVDLILSKDGHKIAVQAKRWAGVVGNKAVQEVIAGKLYYDCSHAWIVTTSTFSVNAVALAAKDPTISLVDGRALSKLCEQFRTVPIPDFSWEEWEKIEHVAERFA